MSNLFPIVVNQLPIFNQIAVLIINSVGVALILTVVNHNSIKNRFTQIFLMMGLLMFLWLDFAYFARLIGGNNLYWSEVFLRIAWVTTPIFFAFIYLITTYIIGIEKKFKILNWTILIGGIFMGIVTGITNIVVEGINFRGINLDIIYGNGFLPFLSIIFLFMLATLIPLFRAKTIDKDKNRIRIFITGVLIFYIANAIFNIVLPFFFGITYLYFLGDYSLIFIIGFTSYSILRYQLLNIKVISTELLTFSLWAFIFFRIFLANNTEERLFTTGLLVATIILGVFLIRGVLKEVSQRQQLAIANKKLERLNLEKSEFLSIASHQLKSPITVIKGYSSMLIEGSYGKFTDKAKEVLNSIFNSAENLVIIIDDFLNVSRIEQGRMKYDFGPVDVKKLVNNITEELSQVAQRTKTELTVTIDKPEENYTIVADYGKIRQVVINLLDNAIKYTSEGFVKVKLSKIEKAEKIHIEIKDNGIGMSRQTISKLFQRFSRAKDIGTQAQSKGGSGLGLYIAREMVLAHGGRIFAESSGEGKGSTFILELPFKPSKNEEIPTDKEENIINEDNDNK